MLYFVSKSFFKIKIYIMNFKTLFLTDKYLSIKTKKFWIYHLSFLSLIIFLYSVLEWYLWAPLVYVILLVSTYYNYLTEQQNEIIKEEIIKEAKHKYEIITKDNPKKLIKK